MIVLQNILVLLTSIIAVGYIVQKFVWKPAFLKNKSGKNGCGESGCGCS